MTFLTGAHHRFFLLLFVYQLIFGVWALILGFRRQPIGGTLTSVLVVDEVLLIVQSIVGLLILLNGGRPNPLHFLYGGLLLILLPLVYQYAGHRQRAGIWLGIVLLFMGGLIVRTYFTG